MKLHSDSAEDVATVSNFREVTVRQYHLDLNVNFDKKEIDGVVKIDFKCCQDTSLGKLMNIDLYSNFAFF